jgi:hypothetical protein
MKGRTVLLIVILAILAIVCLALVAQTNIVQAAPDTQITLGEERPPTIKSVELGASVGNCDLYVVVVDVQLAPDPVEIVTICGDDRTAQ